MKIVICGSLAFTYKFGELKEELEEKGFEVVIPLTSQKIIDGELNFEFINNLKENGGFEDWVKKNDAVRKYNQEILKGDSILVANYEKKGIEDYIGTNSLLEIGFAYISYKKIFLLFDFPKSQKDIYEDVKMLGAIPLKEDLSKLN